jgi:adenine deaminase
VEKNPNLQEIRQTHRWTHAPGLKRRTGREICKCWAQALIMSASRLRKLCGKLKLGTWKSPSGFRCQKTSRHSSTWIDEYPEMIMFCSDDKHPDNLAVSHNNELASRAVAKGKDVFHVCFSLSKLIAHYSL